MTEEKFTKSERYKINVKDLVTWLSISAAV